MSSKCPWRMCLMTPCGLTAVAPSLSPEPGRVSEGWGLEGSSRWSPEVTSCPLTPEPVLCLDWLIWTSSVQPAPAHRSHISVRDDGGSLGKPYPGSLVPTLRGPGPACAGAQLRVKSLLTAVCQQHVSASLILGSVVESMRPKTAWIPKRDA